MSVSYGSSIVTSGLLTCLDAGNAKSYPGSGTAVYDISGNKNHATINGTVSYVPVLFRTRQNRLKQDPANKFGLIRIPGVE